jgi:hypothetical protein
MFTVKTGVKRKVHPVICYAGTEETRDIAVLFL